MKIQNSKVIAIVILLILFLITRLAILFVLKPRYSDLELYYSSTAWEHRLAVNADASLYEYHEQILKLGKDILPNSMLERIYPPLALSFILIPEKFVDVSSSFGFNAYEQFKNDYVIYYRRMLFLFEVAMFFLLLVLMLKIYPRLLTRDLVASMLIFILGGVILCHVLYDRLDIIMGGLVLISLALLVYFSNYLYSFFVLAVAINFKIVPCILVPLWVIGSMPARCFENKMIANNKVNKKLLLNFGSEAIKRTLVVLFLIFLLFLPFLIVDGKKSLAFLSYHSLRGIQIESIYSSIIMTLHYIFGMTVKSIFEFGTWNIISSISPFLSRISIYILFFVVAVVSIKLIFRLFTRGRSTQGDVGDPNITVANKSPALITAYTTLYIMLGILTAKVFSVQYLLWLVPLMPLVLCGKKEGIITQTLFVITCVIATVFFPYKAARMFDEVWVLSAVSVSAGVPSILATVLLLSRNMVFAASCFYLIKSLKK